MQAKFLMASVVALGALSQAGLAHSRPFQLADAQLDRVTAGYLVYDLATTYTYTDLLCCYCPPSPPPPTTTLKANNGWGNGGDPTNPGSPNGTLAQSTTKLDSSLR